MVNSTITSSAVMAQSENAYASMNQAARAGRYYESLVQSEEWRFKALAIRLRIRDGQNFPIPLFTAAVDDTVYLWIITPKGPVTLEDPADMFPSDALITQINLLIS